MKRILKILLIVSCIVTFIIPTFAIAQDVQVVPNPGEYISPYTFNVFLKLEDDEKFITFQTSNLFMPHTENVINDIDIYDYNYQEFFATISETMSSQSEYERLVYRSPLGNDVLANYHVAVKAEDFYVNNTYAPIFRWTNIQTRYGGAVRLNYIIRGRNAEGESFEIIEDKTFEYDNNTQQIMLNLGDIADTVNGGEGENIYVSTFTLRAYYRDYNWSNVFLIVDIPKADKLDYYEMSQSINPSFSIFSVFSDAVSSFMSIEIVKGFTIGTVFYGLIGMTLLLAFIKFFAGG